MLSQIYEISFLSTLKYHAHAGAWTITAQFDQCVPSAVTSPSAQQCTTIGTTLAQPASVVDATMARVVGRAPRRHGRRWRVQRWRGRHWREHGRERRRRGRRWRGQRWRRRRRRRRRCCCRCRSRRCCCHCCCCSSGCCLPRQAKCVVVRIITQPPSMRAVAACRRRWALPPSAA